MKREQARQLVERGGVLRNRCDLDLLLFFARHPYALLTSDQLAAFIGEDVQSVGDSLDLFLNAGLLKRSQNPNSSARLYAFSAGGDHGGWLTPLIELASSRDGRLAVLEALAQQTGDRAQGSVRRRAPNRPLRIHKIG
ncbi:MAG TPA: hypothetical protein VIC33_01950 [Vicinamibacterales bacterium]|jgi:hypothetical protein